ncbi:MAG: dihydrofolate reductase family protein [Candidatus Nitrosocosmicus sp.]|nr:dihydrofolate reductase family protein [Candidatus Nitrosocosmicus sp.]MDN5868371.1 dihydrofolate reductase family protein [Candidatus Nitrosocosmicus sp.]
MDNNKKVMRKLRLQVQISVDGCIAGPNNEMDWTVWDDKYIKYVNDIAESVDTIIMGRKMVDEFISHWSSRMNKSDDPWNAFAKKMIEIPKVVFTKTINKSRWINTDIATGDLKDEITKLKNQNGGDIIVYGGVSFDSSLIKEKLIDEFYLFVNPIAIGNGKPIFKDLEEIQRFTLIESIRFDCGLVLLHYEVKKN